MALKDIPNGRYSTMHSSIKFKSNRQGEDFVATSKPFAQNNIPEWASHFIGRIQELVQSDEIINLSSFKITFRFALLPEGRGHLESKTLLEHYNKRSVIRVINDDANCFWYALANRVYFNHPPNKKTDIRRPIQQELGGKLCQSDLICFRVLRRSWGVIFICRQCRNMPNPTHDRVYGRHIDVFL